GSVRVTGPLDCSVPDVTVRAPEPREVGSPTFTLPPLRVVAFVSVFGLGKFSNCAPARVRVSVPAVLPMLLVSVVPPVLLRVRVSLPFKVIGPLSARPMAPPRVRAPLVLNARGLGRSDRKSVV